MAVAEDDYVRHPLLNDPLLRRGHLFYSGKMVSDIEGSFIDDGQTLIGKAHRVRIVVSPHCDHRREAFQSPDQLFVAYVAGMNDAADAFEQIEDLFVQLAVCV